MALIEINVPEEEGWRDILAARLLLLMLGAVVMRVGLRLYNGVFNEGFLAATGVVLIFATGVELLILAIADIDIEAHGRTIGYATGALLTLLMLLILWETRSAFIARLNSDVLGFTSYAVEVWAQGGNPFVASMEPTHELFGAPDRWTWRTDGSKVTSWSYPGGTLWLYSIQYHLIGRDPIGLRLTSILAVGALSALVTWAVPAAYGPVGPLSLLAVQNDWLAAAGALNDMMWVVPVVGTVILWAREQRVAAAAVFGIACAMKQQAWPIALFLAIWVFHERDGLRDFARTAAVYIGAGLVPFVVLNLPWLAQTPVAWLESVFVPLGAGSKAPLQSAGVGLAAINLAADGELIARSTFEALIYVSVAAATLLYWRYFEIVRWAAWILPMGIFLWTPRSLPSYFYWWLPVAVVALVAAQGRIRGQPPRTEVTAA